MSSDKPKPYTLSEADDFYWKPFEGWRDSNGEGIELSRLRTTIEALDRTTAHLKESDKVMDELTHDLSKAEAERDEWKALCLRDNEHLLGQVARLREALEAMLYDVTPIDGYPSEAAVQRAYAVLEETE